MQFLWQKAGRKLCRNCVKIGGSAALRQAEFGAFAKAPTTPGYHPPQERGPLLPAPFFLGQKISDPFGVHEVRMCAKFYAGLSGLLHAGQ